MARLYFYQVLGCHSGSSLTGLIQQRGENPVIWEAKGLFAAESRKVAPKQLKTGQGPREPNARGLHHEG